MPDLGAAPSARRHAGFFGRGSVLPALYVLLGLLVVGYLISLLARPGHEFVPWLETAAALRGSR